ncbi:cytochrome b [Roseibium denhamense]|uniref:Cytochrome b561 n=1 Tax=Roseibium denhamense TaxID=76305 RepID=A0ABY1NRN0_9HYPH|nr:cytochrome b [Roseibium denhamense]MTI08110.1 cytochrome b [Roseibium denhamense]SMP16499.1 cytochrome b561 [Roseibium denhamense]
MLRNTSSGYGRIAIFFHWTMALLIVGMLAFGLYLDQLPQSDPNLFQLYQLHKSVGFVVLALALMRIIWRFANPSPKLPTGMASWERMAAHLGHIGLYALIFALPITGWFMVSASPWGIPTVVFNVLPIPHLPVPEALGTKEEAEGLFKVLHKYGAYLMIALIVTHIAAALKHHFIARDDTLKRMVSTGPARADTSSSL